MKVAGEELEACKRRLQVEAPEDLVRQAWEEAYGRVGGQAKLAGFRKGHVPRNLLKLHFADEVRREVAQRLIPQVYRQALAETQLHPVEDPDFHDVTLEEGAPLKFTAVVEIKPAIALGTYTGVTVQHAPVPVTDEDLEKALEHLREQHAEFRSVERPAAAGDLVIVDYTLTPEGLEPRREQGYAFLVGSQAVLAEIDEAVIGLAAGGERETRIRFPDDHRRGGPRGKGGAAPGAGGGGEGERESRRALEEKVVDALLAAHEFQVPETMVLRQVARLIEHARERMRRQGVDPDQIKWDYEKLTEELRPGALHAVRRALLLEAIAEKEGVAPADADVEAEVEKIARASQRPAPAVRRLMEKSGDLEGLRYSLREARTVDFLIQHARIES